MNFTLLWVFVLLLLQYTLALCKYRLMQGGFHMPLSHHVILGLPVTELQAKASKGLAGWLESRNTNNTRANGIIITTTHYKTKLIISSWQILESRSPFPKQKKIFFNLLKRKKVFLKQKKIYLKQKKPLRKLRKPFHQFH